MYARSALNKILYGIGYEIMNIRKMHVRDLILSVITILIILNLQILTIGDFKKPIQWITAVAGIAFFCLCAIYRPIWSRISKYDRFTSKWMFVFFLFLGIELFYGLLTTNLSFRVIGSKLYIYLWVLLYYPVLYLVSFPDTRKKLFRRIFIWTFFAMILKTIIWYQYNYHGNVLMYYVLFEHGDYTRNGLQRLTSTPLTGWFFSAALLLFTQSTKVKNKLFSVILILFNLWYAQFVFASRSQIMVLCFCIFFVAITQKKKPLKTLFVYTVVFVSIIAVLNSQYYIDFVNSLSIQTYSIGTRFEELGYYYKLLENHFLFGIETITDMDTIRGSGGNYYISDLGIAGKFFSFGLIGLVIFALPIIRIGIQGTIKASKKDSEYVFASSIAVYTVVFSILSNDIYSWARLFALPFILAYFAQKKTDMARNTEYQDFLGQ